MDGMNARGEMSRDARRRGQKAAPASSLSRRALPALSHYSPTGQPRMVDVTEKPATTRSAKASTLVQMKPATLRAMRRNPKGDPLEIARIAGIAAAKRTAELIPMCHPLLLTHVDVHAEFCKNGVRIVSEIRSQGPTGVEMEALTAAAVSALTVYDMCKAVDRGIEIVNLRLDEKQGGKSGTYRRGATFQFRNARKVRE